MSDYSKTTNFTAKDALPSGNPAKKVLGSLFDTEFDNIETAVNTKYDSADLGVTLQAYDAGLTSIAGLTTAADKGIYATASDTYATFDLTSAARSLLDDASVSAMRTTLGLAIGTDVQAYDAGLASIAGLTTAADRGIYTTASDTYAVFTLTSAGRALLDDASASAQRTTLGLGSLATASTINDDDWSGTDLAVANGGTGASTAGDARTNLGLGSLATASTINDSNWSGTDLAVANGGTGASDASGARTNLGLGSLATQSTVNNGDWSGTDLAVANGGTGSSTAADARTALGLAIGSDVQAYDLALADIAGLTITDGLFLVGNGVGSVVGESGATARTSLGLGTADSPTFAGVTLASGATVTSILDEDTMSSDSATALATQQSIKAYVDATVAAPGYVDTSGTPVANDFARFTDADTVEGRSAAEARADLSLEVGTDVQAYDAGLASIAGLTTAADRMIYTTASDTYAVATLTSFARTLLDDASASAARTTLGLGSLAEASTINDDDWSGTDLAVANGGTGSSTASGARTNLGLAIGTDVQAFDAFLEDLAALTPASGADQFIVSTAAGTFALESGATVRGSLGLGAMAEEESINDSNWSGTDLAVINGGTGASTASGARTNLGLGSLATASTINDSNWSGTDLAVANGGTGSSNASDARTALGLAIGSDVQAYSSVLANTTASFTTADETKLDNIETAADVTDETNVLAALDGATIPAATVAGTDKLLLQDSGSGDVLRVETVNDLISTMNLLDTADIGSSVQGYDADTAKLDVAQSWTAAQTFKEVTETQYSLTGTAIDPANGTVQYKTLSANTTFTESLADGEAVTLMIDDGTAYTITWPTITWVSGGGTAPTLQTSGYTCIVIFQMNGVLYGAAVNGA